MRITQWYNDSPLSEFGICEWNPSLSILLGLPINKCCPGAKPCARRAKIQTHPQTSLFLQSKWARMRRARGKAHQHGLTRSLLGGGMQYRLGLVTEQGSRDIETKSSCFSPHRATLGVFVTHARSDSHRVPRRRNCLAGGLSEAAGGLPNLCELWLETQDGLMCFLSYLS